MKNSLYFPFAVVLLLLTILACSSKYPGFDKTESGLYYKIYHISKDTAKARTGDWVTIEMRYSCMINGKDTVLYNSRQSSAPVKFALPPSAYKGDLYEGIRMMAEGDSADFIIGADSLFIKTFKMDQRPPIVDSNSVLNFHVHLVTLDSPEKMKAKEANALYFYIKHNDITVSPTKSGIYIIESVAGQGISIDTGCLVKLHFSVGTIDGQVIFSSLNQGAPMQFYYGEKFDTPGIEEAIGTMKKGGKAKVIVPSSMGFGEFGKGNIVSPYTTLIYNVEIVDVQANKSGTAGATDFVAKDPESRIIEKFLADNKIKAEPLPSGLYYIEQSKGTGIQAINGKRVKIHYVGTLLNGKKFDSSRDRNEPFVFILGKDKMIPGFEEGIRKMKKGGKAMLIIPSVLAYGNQETTAFPANSTLIYNIELLDVQAVTP